MRSDILDGEDVLVYSARIGGPGGQQVGIDTGVTVFSQALGVGVVVNSERSQHANKTEALRLLRMIAAEKLESARPYVCPGCHAVAPDRCLPGCIDAEIEAENEVREYETSKEDEP